jgi:dethiobiotin synthetase
MSAERRGSGLFVTGTDTGVGKTLVAAGIARFCRRHGIRVGVMKPCETGVDDVRQPGADARLLRWAAGSTDADELLAPYRLPQPLAPAAAAVHAGVHVEPQQIIDCYKKIIAGKDLVIVEGAGGLMVPLRGGYLIADLVRQLSIPLLVVARPTLGTINHTLLTVFAARAMELPVAGLMINGMPAHPDLAAAEAPHQLAALASADLLGVLPEVAGTPEEKIEQLSDAIAVLPTLPWLLTALGITLPPVPADSP